MATARKTNPPKKRVAIACQGGGSHTAFTAGVLQRLLGAEETRDFDIVGISGTSGGAACAFLAWYAMVEGDPAAAGPLLEKFWMENSAQGIVQSLLNASVLWVSSMQDAGMLPAISPYHTPISNLAADQFRDLIRQQVDVDRITVDTDGIHPMLLLGAVDVLSGDFRAFNSRRDRITADCVLASAAIPNLFRSVEVDGGKYWDGLFSQNPPVRELLDVSPDELWVIQINPKHRETEPTTLVEIADRRNELAGNLSLFQELHLIEKIDGLLESGLLQSGGKYKQVVIRVIELSRSSLPVGMGSTSKLNRDPTFLKSLIAHGRAQAEEFLSGIAFERILAGKALEPILDAFADNAKLIVEAPFAMPGTYQGASELRTFWQGQLAAGFTIDATRKQVARDQIIWNVRVRESGADTLGQASATFDSGKIATLKLGPVYA